MSDVFTATVLCGYGKPLVIVERCRLIERVGDDQVLVSRQSGQVAVYASKSVFETEAEVLAYGQQRLREELDRVNKQFAEVEAELVREVARAAAA
jgi:PHD/YefM family antitoxin component YafN of YafNO toxin-antitoxin module